MNNKEIESWERERERKQAQKEYYKERDNKMNEHLAKIEEHIELLARNFQVLTEIKAEQMQKEKELEQGLNGLEYLMKKIHNDRVIEQKEDNYDLDKVGQKEYAMFCAWCNAFKAIKKNDGTIDIDRMKKEAYLNDKYFREYCNTEKISSKYIPSDTIKRYIAERYFGYEYYKDEKGLLRVRKTVEGE